MSESKIPAALYLSFLLDRDKESNKTMPGLHDLLDNRFGANSVSRISEGDENALTREVIYRVSAPPVVSDDVWRDFFENLLHIFEITKDLKPRFTSYEETL